MSVFIVYMYFFLLSFFIGLLKLSTSNSFVMMLISLEMMSVSLFFSLMLKEWVVLNSHFMVSFLVIVVMEGTLGISLLIALFSNSKTLVDGCSGIKL